MSWILFRRIIVRILPVLIALAFANSAQAYEAEVRIVAEKLVARIEASDQKSASVLDFTNLDGKPTMLGRFLAQELSNQLVAASKKLKFVDRANLEQLLRENKLTMAGLVDPATSKNLGNLAGIDTFITGTAVLLGDKIRLSVRAIAAETQIIVALQSTTLKASDFGTFLSGGVETECDRLATNPTDPERFKGVPGVRTAQIDAARAGSACDEAMQQYPDAPRFIYQGGRVAYARRDYARARQLWDQAATANYAIAMSALGGLYRSGFGVPKDITEARRLLEKAASMDVSIAMTSLGEIYTTGEGVPQDYSEARRWYEKAAALEEPIAMASLGVLYLNGWGVRKDYADARTWLERAAALDEPTGMTGLGVLYENGWGVGQDYAQARQWYEKAAALNDTNAMTNLGGLYENGRGVRQSNTDARRWYEKAVALGSSEAQKRIKNMEFWSPPRIQLPNFR